MDVFKNCRICLREINHEPIKMTRQILRFLENLLLTNITKASPHENFKQNLCASCFNRASEFQDFIEQCKDSDDFWKEQFEDIEKSHRAQVTFEETVLCSTQGDGSFLEADTTVSTTEVKREKNTQSKEVNDENVFHPSEVEFEQNLQFEEKEKNNEIDEPTNMDDLTSIDLTNWQEESNDVKCETEKNVSEFDDSARNVDEEIIEYEYKLDGNEEVEIEEISNFDEAESQDTCDVDYGSFTYEQLETEKPRGSNTMRETINEPIEETSETTRSTFFLSTSVDDNGKVKMTYQCPKCDKSFNRIYDIESHYNIHSGIKPFTCDVCGKSFRQKNILTTHQALHFGKKVECAECGKKFARRSQLILHYRMHRDEKPFVCNVDGCEAAFRQRKQLIDHSFIHTGEKKFQCATCEKPFHTRKRLQDHLYKVHSQHRYRCELCEKAFLKPHMLKHHMMTAHNVEIDDVSHLKTLIDVTNPAKKRLKVNL